MKESNIKKWLKESNWFRGQSAANAHFKKYGLHFLDNPQTQFGAGFNETMSMLDMNANTFTFHH